MKPAGFFMWSDMKNKHLAAAVLALLAALFYALSMPFSRLLLRMVQPAMMASLLYLGAGIGVGILYLFKRKSAIKAKSLDGQDFPYVLGMVALDIVAPILLMQGLKSTASSAASLLNNFEIVATSLIALMLFKELISRRLWLAITLITLSSLLLSFDVGSGLHFSPGALLVLLAAVCWGLENNCTRRLSDKNTYQIVTIKGIFSGLGALIVALLSREALPQFADALPALLLGFVAYGLSIFFYIRAQKELGAAKTSAYYAAAPFVGALLSFILLKEALSPLYLPSLMIMLLGTWLLVKDTLAGQQIQ